MHCIAAPKWASTVRAVERNKRRQEHTAESALELVLATGERLRIGLGVDITTFRTVLDVLRG